MSLSVEVVSAEVTRQAGKLGDFAGSADVRNVGRREMDSLSFGCGKRQQASVDPNVQTVTPWLSLPLVHLLRILFCLYHENSTRL